MRDNSRCRLEPSHFFYTGLLSGNWLKLMGEANVVDYDPLAYELEEAFDL